MCHEASRAAVHVFVRQFIPFSTCLPHFLCLFRSFILVVVLFCCFSVCLFICLRILFYLLFILLFYLLFICPRARVCDFFKSVVLFFLSIDSSGNTLCAKMEIICIFYYTEKLMSSLWLFRQACVTASVRVCACASKSSLVRF